MIAVGSHAGYAHANVSTVIAHAGVSRPTFYDYFSDRDACFLAALEDVHQRLLARVLGRVRESPPERALQATIGALIELASEEPAATRFLTSEALGGGPLVLGARDQGLAQISRMVELEHTRAPARAPIPDVSPRMLLGGTYRLLAARLRRGEPGLSRLLDDLLAWVESYERPLAEHRWRSLGEAWAPPRSPFVSGSPLRAPAPLGPGRPRLAPAEVADNQRLRILFAAATLAEAEGYGASTVADIMRLASVDGRTFYTLFANKQEAFMAAHELGLQQVLWVTSTAFFAAHAWPQRVWEAARAFTQFLEINPLIAHVGFVEAYAVGPATVQRVEDSHFVFTMFLQEGYLQTPASGLSRLALEAIITTIFELMYSQARERQRPVTPALIERVSFLCLAPFLGVDDANSFIDERRLSTVNC
jgi:AcrR family transcriptional regulator